ncbi:phosphotyrosyl phosphatase activator [Xylona heveae TC161]|uniref:Serine/threonine-protein phosphatase 2A activator n=1 Tax=Xylona heveae (strain CBS 132557 / TC161) TaxID=1328760 RepID=A0A165FHY3_XYLHT|nr:phosphotyrosyl phosphatase activator [Xylona heveae TC161]KZF21000.1 phosphotyrosyl phosphatase activator [Xylona heveae TC161]
MPASRPEIKAPRPRLPLLNPSNNHTFIQPTKRINDGQDIANFLTSEAYHDIVTFLMQLNASMFPTVIPTPEGEKNHIQTWEAGTNAVVFSNTVLKLKVLLEDLEGIIAEAPPDQGPRRFGNISFRKWYQIVESRLPELLKRNLPAQVRSFHQDGQDETSPVIELESYLLGAFGSAQRLDYGTGHELSFLAFLGGIWKLNGFATTDPGVEERGIVLGVFVPYLSLVRRLIKTYSLEPAGSHGVWGLDDHSFIPYILGSAQLSPPITKLEELPSEGSLPGAPDPAAVVKALIVERERHRNLYFDAIGFIYDVKKGPFWEHSPILYDISGVPGGWAKINKGMIKMYNAEVLSKFPVVQHFPFGSLFQWQQDPHAMPPPVSAHISSQPARASPSSAQAGYASAREPVQEGTRAPWAQPTSMGRPPMAATAAPWSRHPDRTGLGTGSTHNRGIARDVDAQAQSSGDIVGTRAPWAK